ncbi:MULTISPECIES: HisA/HisF-related TIM barrel protein [Flavobacteriaceae]|uniref:HisA/HisF-related TIM barrel protein n=1 Tax=Flavobacteriaceae TaxID=49546 RepID=UPI0039046538
MFNKRIIPQLLISKNKLVKTENFKSSIYVGDPINTAKIFNEKEIDELSIIDIGCTRYNYEPNYELIEKIANECFMPISYGGGITNFEQASKILRSGVEKIIIQSSLFKNPEIINEISESFGAQSIILSLDFISVKNSYRVFKRGVFKNYTKLNIQEALEKLNEFEFGELQLMSVDREGTLEGLDIDILKIARKYTEKPIIFCGGAKSINDISIAFENGAFAVGVGRLFTLHGPFKAVLIDYPSRKIINQIL